MIRYGGNSLFLLMISNELMIVAYSIVKAAGPKKCR
jgi:hypothetical protein